MQILEVRSVRSRRPRPLGRLHGRLAGGLREDEHAPRAVVSRARGPSLVFARRGVGAAARRPARHGAQLASGAFRHDRGPQAPARGVGRRRHLLTVPSWRLCGAVACACVVPGHCYVFCSIGSGARCVCAAVHTQAHFGACYVGRVTRGGSVGTGAHPVRGIVVPHGSSRGISRVKMRRITRRHDELVPLGP